jgi:hypothetical protein
VIDSFEESAAETARRAVVDRKTVLKMRHGEPLDRIRREAFDRYAIDRAREIMKAADPDARVHSIHDETLLTRYLELTGHSRRPLWELVCDVIRDLPVEEVAAGAEVLVDTVERACDEQTEKTVFIATNQRSNECSHHHRSLTAAWRCCTQMERHYRRRYAGRPGYAPREEWFAEPMLVPVHSKQVGKTTRAKLARYAVGHARAELRKAGVQPPAEHEALLTAYLAHGWAR